MRHTGHSNGLNSTVARVRIAGLVASLTLCLLAAGLFGISTVRRLGMPVTMRPDGRINPNTAAAASLVRLPGVGPSRALAIIEHRRMAIDSDPCRVFASCEDLCRVKGIGPVTIEKIKPYLKFE